MNLDARKTLSIRKVGVAGVLTPIIAYSGIVIAILLNSDWFVLTDNALSDLGHYGNLGLKALIFNGGLVISGLLALVFCSGFYYQEREAFKDDLLGKRFAILGSIALIIAILALIAIGIFSEDFGYIHRFVSEVFFTTIPFAMWFFGIAFYRRVDLKFMGIYAFIVGTAAGIIWILYFVFNFVSGVAIPEAVSSIAVSIWVILRGTQYYKLKEY